MVLDELHNIYLKVSLFQYMASSLKSCLDFAPESQKQISTVPNHVLCYLLSSSKVADGCDVNYMSKWPPYIPEVRKPEEHYNQSERKF